MRIDGDPGLTKDPPDDRHRSQGAPPMRTLRYSINVTLDGCVDHMSVNPTEEMHRFHAASLEQADALLFGRVTYGMMEEAWRRPEDGVWPEWMADWMVPFAETIDAKQKYVVSSTLEKVDWNSELVEGDLATAVRELKDQPGGSLYVGGVTLPTALAELGLIDVYEFLVHPVVAGHGPRLLDGLATGIQLQLLDRHELESGAIALRYQPASNTN
jgi:dihydrofolate reductase